MCTHKKEETDEWSPLVRERSNRLRNVGMDDMWICSTVVSKATIALPNNLLISPQLLFHSPQLTTAFAKATAQPNTL
jgi:hypothetical protein